MELKTKKPSDKKDAAAGKANDILKQKINVFLINYFGYLTLAAALMIMLAAGWLILYPRYRKIANDNEIARQNMQTEYDEQADLLQSIIKLKQAYGRVSEDDRNKINAMVPPAGDPSGLITEIEALAAKNSVILNSVRLEPMNVKSQPASQAEPGEKAELGEKKEPPAGVFTGPPRGIGLIRLEISLSSLNYPVLKNVIKTIENNVRILDVAKINYSVSEKKASLTAYAYYLADER